MKKIFFLINLCVFAAPCLGADFQYGSGPYVRVPGISVPVLLPSYATMRATMPTNLPPLNLNRSPRALPLPKPNIKYVPGVGRVLMPSDTCEMMKKIAALEARLESLTDQSSGAKASVVTATSPQSSTSASASTAIVSFPPLSPSSTGNLKPPAQKVSGRASHPLTSSGTSTSPSQVQVKIHAYPGVLTSPSITMRRQSNAQTGEKDSKSAIPPELRAKLDSAPPK